MNKNHFYKHMFFKFFVILFGNIVNGFSVFQWPPCITTWEIILLRRISFLFQLLSSILIREKNSFVRSYERSPKSKFISKQKSARWNPLKRRFLESEFSTNKSCRFSIHVYTYQMIIFYNFLTNVFRSTTTAARNTVV